jgi:molybdopterin-biosynthesis enzyme MoeA-like protein
MFEHYGLSLLTSARLQMARLPSKSHVIDVPGLWVPLVVLGGVCYVYPGIPSLFQRMLEATDEHLPNGFQSFSGVVYSDCFESDFANSLKQIATKYSMAGVEIGSYPSTNPNSGYNVKISVTANDQKLVNEVIKEILPQINGFTALPDTPL